MRFGDTPEQHEKKVARKRRELTAKGWSEKRIENYLRHWERFDCRSAKT